jgi:lipopolysaccharide biosynthesis glycosyltransferase
VHDDAIDIVFCCDDKFSGQLQVAALSTVLNTPSTVTFYVVDCGISQNGKDGLLSLKAKYPNVRDIIFREPVREEIFENFPISACFSSAVFYRLAIPKTFPELERAIYMDCDVIVDGDIGELWQVDLNGRAFAAMEEEGVFYAPEDMVNGKARIGIPQECICISSGILLMDCKRFEETRVFERILEFVGTRKEPLPCPEQDAMDICLAADEHVPLDPKFNFTLFAPLAKKRLREIKKPLIIHYSWWKPWCFNRKIVNYAYKLGLFRYSFGLTRKYWEYADRVDGYAFSTSQKKTTFYFMYRCIFGKIEHFIAKRVRNGIIRLWRRIFQKKDANGKW